MVKVENIKVDGLDVAIRAMRHPMESYSKSDSYYDTERGLIIGENDLDLMQRLYKSGQEHRTYARQIQVWMDITLPLYTWKELDRYTVGKSQVSTSTMHKIHAKEFTLDDFSHEHLISEYNQQKPFEVDFDESNAILKTIPDYPDYKISENGIVYSYKSGEKKQLSCKVDIDGYKTIGLYNNGKCKRFKIHRLVAICFIPKINGKDCVNHIDGNKWNNTVNNLEWCTPKENSLHASQNGLLITGSKQKKGMAKRRRYTAEQIADIKNLYESGVSQRKIGEMFGCDHSVISEIVNNKTYKPIITYPLELLEEVIEELNELRQKYIETKDKEYWYSMIQLLPSSYNQKRTINMSYEVVFKIIKERKNHKLDEWNEFVKILEDLPYVKEIMNGIESKEG